MMNSLNNASGLSYTKEQIGAALAKIGQKENVRGEALTLEQFAKFSDELNQL